jgi:hypothetical protein
VTAVATKRRNGAQRHAVSDRTLADKQFVSALREVLGKSPYTDEAAERMRDGRNEERFSGPGIPIHVLAYHDGRTPRRGS